MGGFLHPGKSAHYGIGITGPPKAMLWCTAAIRIEDAPAFAAFVSCRSHRPAAMSTAAAISTTAQRATTRHRFGSGGSGGTNTPLGSRP